MSSTRKFSQPVFQQAKNLFRPLDPSSLYISPAHKVPNHIIRPPYVGQNPQVYPDLQKDPIIVHDQKSIKSLKSAADLAQRTLTQAIKSVQIGTTCDDIDKVVHDYIVADGAYPSAIDFMHFPKSVCTSVNEVVSHGVPTNHALKDGDFINIDVVCYKDGFHGDNSAMVMVGDVHPEIEQLNRITREAMFKAIDACQPGVKFSKIGEIIEEYASAYGYHVNRDFGGHGIGQHMHMPPMILHYKSESNCKLQMKPGMAFTIEPILMTSRNYQYVQWSDGWTICAPGIGSCQWEHMVLVTEQGREVITLRDGETWPEYK